MSKQVIVVRQDLKMPSGKLGSQVAHASISAFMRAIIQEDLRDYKDTDIKATFTLEKNTPIHDWITGDFTKIVLGVNTEDALESLFKRALDEGIPASRIVDNGTTVFNEPTLTCVGLGPASNEMIDKVTGLLKLYK